MMDKGKNSTNSILLGIAGIVIVLLLMTMSKQSGQATQEATAPVAQQSDIEEPPVSPQLLEVSHMTGEKYIAAAIDFYCSSTAPINPAMWAANGGTGQYIAVSLASGEVTTLVFDQGTEQHAIVLSAADTVSNAKLESWGCPSSMEIYVTPEW